MRRTPGTKLSGAPLPIPSSPSVAYRVALLLTWLAGLVDAAGFLTFSHIYTANMSGNSVGIGIGLGERNWPEAALRFWPVLFYVIGLLAARIAIEIGARCRIRRIASCAFSFEAVLLVVAIWSGHLTGKVPRSDWLAAGIAFLATAMGIQNAALTHFSSLTLHTGFVTGSLVKFAEQFVRYGTWVWDNTRKNRSLTRTLAQSSAEQSFEVSCFLALTWCTYVLGAVAGAWGTHNFQLRILFVAVAALALLTTVDMQAPLAIQDENEQGKA